MLAGTEALGLEPAARAPDGAGPALEEGETVLAKFERLALAIGGAHEQGEGTLFITETRVIWLSAADASLGYAAAFPAIAMHAVVTDEASGQPCLYLQLDNGEEDGEGFAGFGVAPGGDEEAEEGEEEEEGEGSEEEGLAPELRLTPADGAQLEPLFQAFCEGAERNPDFTSDEDEEAAGFVYNEDEALAGAAAAALGMGDVEELVGADADRFADPEEEEEDECEGFEEEAGRQQQNGGC